MSEVIHSFAVVSATTLSGFQISSKGREKVVVPASEGPPRETSTLGSGDLAPFCLVHLQGQSRGREGGAHCTFMLFPWRSQCISRRSSQMSYGDRRQLQRDLGIARVETAEIFFSLRRLLRLKIIAYRRSISDTVTLCAKILSTLPISTIA